MADQPRWRTPLCPRPGEDQGDPFLVEAPAGATGSRYYIYVSAPGFPVYAGDDLLDPSSWRRVGESYPGLGRERWCWAPCVRYVPTAARPWVMLYSRAVGAGDPAGHQGHKIRRADAVAPEGPFRDSGEVLSAGLEFAIDPDVRVTPHGRTRQLFATDFVQDEPFGTGLVEADIDADLRRLTGEVRVVARGGADWQVYDAHRAMPWKHIPGVRWDRGDTVRWTTIEGPAGLTSADGRAMVLYSGGNFAGLYGLGLLVEQQPGTWVDLSRSAEDLLLAPDPAAGLFGPGHCSVLTTRGTDMFLCYHFRAQPQVVRQFTVVPLHWDQARDRPCLVRE